MEIVTIDGADEAIVEEFRRWLGATPAAARRRRFWSLIPFEDRCLAFVNALFEHLQDQSFEDQPVAWVGEVWSSSRGWTAHVWVEYREHRLEATRGGAVVSPAAGQREHRRPRRRIALEAFREGAPIRWLEPTTRWLSG